MAGGDNEEINIFVSNDGENMLFPTTFGVFNEFGTFKNDCGNRGRIIGAVSRTANELGSSAASISTVQKPEGKERTRKDAGSSAEHGVAHDPRSAPSTTPRHIAGKGRLPAHVQAVLNVEWVRAGNMRPSEMRINESARSFGLSEEVRFKKFFADKAGRARKKKRDAENIRNVLDYGMPVRTSVRTTGNSDVGNCGDFELESSARNGVYID